MSLLSVFFRPNIEKLKHNKDVKGLIQALGNQKDPAIRQESIDALGEVGNEEAVTALIQDLERNTLEPPDKRDAAIVKIVARQGMDAVKAMQVLTDKNPQVYKTIETVFLRTASASANTLLNCFVEANSRNAGYFSPVYKLAIDTLMKMDNIEALNALMRISLDRYTSRTSLDVNGMLLGKSISVTGTPRLLSGLKSDDWSECELSAKLLQKNPGLLQGVELDNEQRAILAVVERDWAALEKLEAVSLIAIRKTWFILVPKYWERVSMIVAQFGDAEWVERVLKWVETQLSRGSIDEPDLPKLLNMLDVMLQITKRNSDRVSTTLLQKMALLNDIYKLRYVTRQAYEDTDDLGVTKYYDLPKEAAVDCIPVKQFAAQELAKRADKD